MSDPAPGFPGSGPTGAGDPASADTAPTLVQAGLKGLCPRCGSPGLYAGLLRFVGRCPRCGLDIGSFNVGDGPAAFLTLILGALVVGLAIWLQLALDPPWWVHVLIWIPFMIATTIGSLRIAKAMLLAAEYRNAAQEGRIRE
jgi:uncharacterized protein (DUF983 family)